MPDSGDVGPDEVRHVPELACDFECATRGVGECIGFIDSVPDDSRISTIEEVHTATPRNTLPDIRWRSEVTLRKPGWR